jgi:esterase/lipase
MFRNKSQLFLDPHITYPVHDIQLKFSDYIAQSKQIIATHRLDLLQQFKEFIIQANSPFELRPAQAVQHGALLIHGLFDSPFIMRDIGQKLFSKKLLIRSILLPGHGTVPGALLNTQYNDWLEAVHYGISSFKGEVEKLFIVGFSIGGAIACYQALQSLPIPVAGLILLTPAFKIRSPFAFLSGSLNKLGNFWPRLKWVSQWEENDYVKYRSDTINAVYQTEQLLNKLTQQPTLPYPQFIAASSNDKTVDTKATLNHFAKHFHPKNRMVLYTNQKMVFSDTRITVRNSYYPEQRILDMSHIGIPISPTNPHYGTRGNYLLASHTSNDDSEVFYDEINQSEVLFYQWLFKHKLTKKIHYRLTFNPDFDFLMQSIDEFVESVLS